MRPLQGRPGLDDRDRRVTPDAIDFVPSGDHASMKLTMNEIVIGRLAAVTAAVEETGASSMKDMGQVMKAAQSRLAGTSVDGKLLSETVRARLQG